MQISGIETDSKITADLVESQKLMVPELGRDGGPWNALELAVRPEAPREDCRIRLSSCISDHGDTSQPEMDLNSLTATWSTNYTGFRPITRKELRVLARGPIRLLPSRSSRCWPREHAVAHRNSQGTCIRLMRRSGVVGAGVVRKKYKL